MPSSPLRVLNAQPIDTGYDSDLDIDTPDAETALLRDYRESRVESDDPLPAEAAPVGEASSPRHRHFVRVVVIALFSVFLIEFGDFLQRPASTRAFEDIVCQKYYESTAPIGTHISLPIPEKDCKGPIIQGELAMLKGWDTTFSCIPGLFLAIPFGYISDRYGRRIVLLLSLTGVVLTLVWGVLIGMSYYPVLKDT